MRSAAWLSSQTTDRDYSEPYPTIAIAIGRRLTSCTSRQGWKALGWDQTHNTGLEGPGVVLNWYRRKFAQEWMKVEDSMQK